MPYPALHPASDESPPALLEHNTFRDLFPVESDYIEFKRGIGARSLQEAVVAFSNADGGVILIGVNDDGEPVGLEIGQETEARVHAAVSEVVSPGRYSLRTLVVGRPTPWPTVPTNSRPHRSGSS